MGAEKMSLEERKLRRRMLKGLGVPSFREFLMEQGHELTRAVRRHLILPLRCGELLMHR